MTCPDVDQLEEYLTGQLDDPSSQGVALHVQRCGQCGSRLTEISDNLRALAPIRQALARTASRPAHLPSVPGYQIVRELARGGMGVIYLAQQENPPRRVALKVLRQDFATDGLELRLQREAHVLAQLQHPGIAAIYQAGLMTPGPGAGPAGPPQAFIAMEYVEGRRLDHWTADFRAQISGSKAAIPQVLWLLAKICDAVHHAHVKGVVHRDLKPGNILVVDELQIADCRPSTPERRVKGLQSAIPKVIDFGVARLTDCDVQIATLHTHAGQLLGTLPYMSPEQVSGDVGRVDTRSDVYALGVVAYEVLSGRLPYAIQQRSLPAAARAIQEETPVRLGKVDRRLRGDLEVIVAKALEKEPERRYQSAAELAADLRRAMRNEPIVGRSPSLTYQLGKLARRHRGVFATSAVATVAVLAALITAVWQAHAATQQRDLAEERRLQAEGAAHYLLSGIGARLGSILGAEELERQLSETALGMHARLVAESATGGAACAGPGDDWVIQARYCKAVRKVIRHALEVGELPRAVALGGILEEWIARHSDVASQSAELSSEISAAYLALASAAAADGRAADADHWRASAAQTEPRLAPVDVAALLATAGSWAVAHDGARPEAVRRLADAAWASRHDGATALAAGDNDASATHYAAAIEILDALLERDPACDPVYGQPSPLRGPLAPPIPLHAGSRPNYQRHKITALVGLAKAERARGDRAAEQFACEQALTLARRQLMDAPRDPRAIDQLADVELRSAARLAELMDWAGAKQHFVDAIGRHQLLAEVDPRSLYRRRALVNALERMAQLSATAGDADAANWTAQLAAARAGLAQTEQVHEPPLSEDGQD